VRNVRTERQPGSWVGSAVSAAALAGSVLVAACNAELVTLGTAPLTQQSVDAAPGASEPEPPSAPLPTQSPEPDAAPPSAAPSFAEPVLIAELGSDSKDDNPTLTADLTELYFTSTRGGDADVWVARRANATEPFAEPEPLAIVNSEEFDSSPAVSPNGLELWLGSKRGVNGDVEIFVSRRASRDAAWSEPEVVAELNSSADDIPRPVDNSGLLMPLASRREGDNYLTFLARRETSSAPFSAPVLLGELLVEDANTVDAFLTDEPAGILFVHAQDELGDLFFAPRVSESAFGVQVPVASLNTTSDERDPWLSPDGETLFFASNRGGELQLYQAARER
jgi:hypothetical protein